MPKQIPWYKKEKGLFGPKYLRDYKDVITPERTRKEVKFIEKALNLKKGQKILDLCCGHGRHSIELALRGYQVVGQDVNKFFLQKAKEAAKAKGVAVKFIESDMRIIPFEKEFDAVINIFTSFGFLESDKEDQKVLNQVFKALKRGGKFLLDTNNREKTIRDYREKGWQENEDGSYVLMKRNFDFTTGSNIEQRIRIEPDGSKEVFQVIVRMYTLPELIKMLSIAKLDFLKAYGDFDGSDYTADSRRFILIAKK